MKALQTWMYLVIVLTSLLINTSGLAKDVDVKGYYRKDGTYVAPHRRSAPNGTKLDNWSTRGNVNPYTGKVGTVDPNPSIYVTPSLQSTNQQENVPQNNRVVDAFRPTNNVPSIPPALNNDPYIRRLENRVLDLEERIELLELMLANGGVPTNNTRSSTAGDAAANVPILNGASKVFTNEKKSTSSPSLDQWRKIKPWDSQSLVEKTLGKPQSIHNSGNGEVWKYDGGGWVEFYSIGTVYKFGGYSF